MATILVTGGNGLIGGAVIKKLLDEGHKIHLLDLRNELPENDNLIYFKGNVLNPLEITKAIKDCEYVVHLAAFMGVKNSLENPSDCLNVNILGTRNVMDACVNNNIRRILFASSSEVYGDSKVVPTSETVDKLPKSEYGISKVACEEYLKSYKKVYDLDYVIVRFFSIYGVRQITDYVVPRFIDQAMKGEDVTVYGEGNQVRTFCYVEDAAEGVVKALFLPKAANHIFNVGDDSEPITMLDLAEKIVSIVGKGNVKKISMEVSDRTKDREIYRRIPDISKAREILGFNPRVKLEEGIKTFLEKNSSNNYVKFV